MPPIAPVVLLTAALALVTGCAPVAVVPSAPPATTTDPTDAPAGGPRPILIDTDMAADDLLAVMALLREPSVDVRAIAVDGNGEVHCLQGVRHMQHLLEAFGVMDVPVGCGRETPGPSGRLFPDEWRAAADAFYGVELPPLQGSTTRHDAAQLLADTIAASPSPLTIVALGTWTNLADAFAADPSLIGRVAGIHAMAGAIDVPGNIEHGEVKPEHGVEWNVGVDPESVAAVLATDVPVTLVPLDATNDVPVPPDFASTLGADHEAAGADIAFEMFARTPSLTQFAWFWDTLAAMALVDPSLVEWENLTIEVETDGLSAGRFVRSPTGRPVRAAMSADPEAFLPALLAALRRGPPRPEPFEATPLDVSWDGTTCRVEGAPPTTAGTVLVTLVNRSDQGAGVLLAGVEAPRTWADVTAFIESMDASGHGEPPAWVIQLGEFSMAEPGARASSIIEVPAGEIGAVCAGGSWPEITFAAGSSFTVGP